MIDWFAWITATYRLSVLAARALQEEGFVVMEGPFSRVHLEQLVVTYDRAVHEATEPDKRVGRSSTRVHDLINRDAAFDRLVVYPPCYRLRNDRSAMQVE